MALLSLVALKAAPLCAFTLNSPDHTYEVGLQVGKGGQGRVYCALDESGVLYALKSRKLGEQHHQERAFDIGIQLDHPHIMKCYELFVDDEKAWMVMEYVHGRTLTDFPTETVDKFVAIELGLQFLDALEHLTTHNCFHRDLFSYNIMIDSKNQIKLIDLDAFGSMQQEFFVPDLTHGWYFDKISRKLSQILELGVFKPWRLNSIVNDATNLPMHPKFRRDLHRPITTMSRDFILDYLRTLKEILQSYNNPRTKWDQDRKFWP